MTIDICDPSSYGEEILSILSAHEDIIAQAEHSDDFEFLTEATLPIALSRQRVRGWHYARLTETDRARMRDGIVPASGETVWLRLQDAVRDGHITSGEAEALFGDSVIHHIGRGHRAGRFYAVPAPLPIEDPRVSDLLKRWGGEALFANAQGGLLKRLTEIGHPTIVEIEFNPSDVLLVATYMLIDYWALARGFTRTPSLNAWEVTSEIPSIKVLGFHQEGSDIYDRLGGSIEAHSSWPPV